MYETDCDIFLYDWAFKNCFHSDADTLSGFEHLKQVRKE